MPSSISLYPFPALLSSFHMTFIIKGNANNGRNLSSCAFPTPMTLFPNIAHINKEGIGCINKEAIGTINGTAIGAINETVIGDIIAARNPPF